MGVHQRMSTIQAVTPALKIVVVQSKGGNDWRKLPRDSHWLIPPGMLQYRLFA
jgi:hypothetical protein